MPTNDLSADSVETSTATLMAFRRGVRVFSQPGALPASSLEPLITTVRDLDVDEAQADSTAEKRSA